MLSEQQNDLIAAVLSSTEYIEAFRLLSQNEEIVDDAVLEQLLDISRSQFEQGEYQAAQTIADLALLVDDRGEAKTKIDLYLAHGNALVKLNRTESAYSMYLEAIEIAQESGIIYGVPAALSMLGQIDLQNSQSEQSSQRLREAVILSQQPNSGMNLDSLMTLLSLFIKAFRQKEQDEREIMDEVFSLIQPEYRNQVFSYFQGINSNELEKLWFEYQVRHHVELVDLPNLDTLDVMRVLRDQLKDAKPSLNDVKPSTNVLVDRRINNLPFTRVFTTLESLSNNLEDASTLIHEFTHFWSFNSNLGYYFSLHIVWLTILEFMLGKYSVERSTNDKGPLEILKIVQLLEDKKEGLNLLYAYLQYQAKVLMLWQVWQPWAEGLALFAEIHLDLTESGELWLSLSRFLSALPTITNPLKKSAISKELDRDFDNPRDYVLSTVGVTEQLQKRVRDARLQSGFLREIYVENLSKKISNEYFAGYSLVYALWMSWAKRCPPLVNSSRFFEVLLWLTHSSFDDLVPTWQLSVPAFSQQIFGNFTFFLQHLFDTQAESLFKIVKDLESSIVPANLSSKRALDFIRNYQSYDLWDYIRTGEQFENNDTTMDITGQQLKLGIAKQFTPNPESFIKYWDAEVNELLSITLFNSTLHLLSESDFEIRLYKKDSFNSIIGMGRGVQGGEPTFLFTNLDDKEYSQLAAESHIKKDGSAKVYQFIFAKKHPTFEIVFAFPVALKYGSVFLSPKSLRNNGITAGIFKITKSHVNAMRNFLDDKARQGRERLAQSLSDPMKDLMSILSHLQGNAGTAKVEETVKLEEVRTELVKFKDLVIGLYLSPLISPELSSEFALQSLLKHRLTALLPPDSDNFFEKRALYALSRQSGSLTRSVLAAQVKTKKEDPDVDALLVRMRDHALNTWKQELLILDRDLVRLGGLQQVNTPSVPFH